MDRKGNKKSKNRHRMHIVAILCLLLVYGSAQALVQQQAKSNSQLAKPATTQSKNKDSKKIIELKEAQIIDKRLNFSPDILLNEVILYHDGAYMYCDSAYLNRNTNTFEAFGTVRVEQGDTLFLYGKYLEYDGNTKFLKVRNEVRLENTKDEVTLFTDSLDYDRVRDIGYYYDGGMLIDKDNELTSFWGQYEPSKNLAEFRDSVLLINPKFVMNTLKLIYDTKTKVATFDGFTTIESDSAYIYSTKGWYNTDTEESLLLDQSRIVNKEGNRSLIGDSILYDKKSGFGEVFGNMFLEDTTKKIILKGDYGYYNDIEDYAMATKRALAIEYSQGDSLFIHADTLKMLPDSTFKIVRAYHSVRFFRTDVQGVADSLQFSSRDSILHLFRDPVLWNENQQIMGDTITVYFNDSTVEMAHIRPNAYAIQDIDSVHYNQMKGKSMKAYFDKKELTYIYVEGNAESIFYPEEEDKTMIGMNQTESSYLSMNFKDKNIERVKLWPKATGKMIPIPDLRPDQGKLKDFEWYDYLRPLDKDDVFREVAKKSTNTPARRRVPKENTVTPSPKVETKTEVEVETDTEGEAKVEIKTETEVNDETKQDVEVKTAEQTDLKVKNDIEQEAEIELKTETEVNAETKQEEEQETVEQNTSEIYTEIIEALEVIENEKGEEIIEEETSEIVEVTK